MILRGIELQNWKAFENARFHFPRPEAGRNVILIGAPNGYGKTSLFEAIALGLYGKDGLRLVLRAGAAADEERRAFNYGEFLQRALNRRAAAAGRMTCRVTLRFEDERRVPIEVERAWFFTESGKLRSGQNAETVRIFVGEERKVQAPPRSETEPDAWYREWIARTFLPADMATFFLFDGEMAAVYAERDMALQVRIGIEGLLGLVWFRRLGEALRDYASHKRQQVPRGLNAALIEKLEAEIAVLNAEVQELEGRLGEIARELAAAEPERQALIRVLMDHGGRTQADLEQITRDLADHRKELELAKERLAALVETDLPFALVGRDLSSRLSARLEAERRREQWLAAIEETRARLDAVLASIDADLQRVSPPLATEQMVGVKEAFKRGIERFWNPPPEGSADSLRHFHAAGSVRGAIASRIEQGQRVAAQTLSDLVATIDEETLAVRRLRDALEQARLTGPEVEDKRVRLNEIEARVRALEHEKGSKETLLRTKRSELSDKRAELGRQTELLDQSARPARLAKRAEELAAMLDALVEDALPLQAKEIAEAMTRAIQAMAHKKDLFRKVEITPEFEIKLLGPTGQNLREVDLSAGEKQVFTQALFYAVAAVSRRAFPVLIDTPLGRLDEQHRLNVLRFLAERDGQVFLISTDTEVVGPYLAAIRDRVAKAYRIENRREGEIGRSWPVEGYFVGERLELVGLGA
ncbi:MAG: DNA sulfur modification protein DndD [Rhodovarius sp.]|nr:DNA sulfur modification protein DndD [Rhodovarius sp.]